MVVCQLSRLGKLLILLFFVTCFETHMTSHPTDNNNLLEEQKGRPSTTQTHSPRSDGSKVVILVHGACRHNARSGFLWTIVNFQVPKPIRRKKMSWDLKQGSFLKPTRVRAEDWRTEDPHHLFLRQTNSEIQRVVFGHQFCRRIYKNTVQKKTHHQFQAENKLTSSSPQYQMRFAMPEILIIYRKETTTCNCAGLNIAITTWRTLVVMTPLSLSHRNRLTHWWQTAVTDRGEFLIVRDRQELMLNVRGLP